MTGLSFAWERLWGLIQKEFIQLKRDRMTFAMLIGLPFMQLMLFGYALNADPKNLATAVVQADDSIFVRDFLKAMENTGYFEFTENPETYEEATRMMKSGKIEIIFSIPPGFTEAYVKGKQPSILMEVDATDPIASSGAISAASQAVGTAMRADLTGVFSGLAPGEDPMSLIIHPLYNPENKTSYNTVPGLIGVMLTMTLVMVTSIALARERERGTLENLYAMPLKASEVMIGKIVPFIIGSFIQVVVVLVVARYLFQIPMFGSYTLLAMGVILFIVVNLSVGFSFSTIAKTQLQAMQMSMFYFLPSILLSGFIYPFDGMPKWAQVIGAMLPLTYFLRIIRNIMLKGADFVEVLPHVWPLLIILAVVSTIALKRYKATLD